MQEKDSCLDTKVRWSSISDISIYLNRSYQVTLIYIKVFGDLMQKFLRCSLNSEDGCNNFSVHLIGHEVLRLNDFWVCPCVYQDEISFWIYRHNKVDCSPQCWWISSSLFRAWMKQKLEKGETHTHTPALFFPALRIKLEHLMSYVRLSDWELHHWLLRFLSIYAQITPLTSLGLHLAERRL